MYFKNLLAFNFMIKSFSKSLLLRNFVETKVCTSTSLPCRVVTIGRIGSSISLAKKAENVSKAYHTVSHPFAIVLVLESQLHSSLL